MTPVVAAIAFGVLYASYSLSLQRHLRTNGNDLAIFDQAVQRYAHLQAPVVEIKGPGFNLLGDHFHPIVALLAPFYRVFPHASTLLVGQAVLVAASVIPVGRLAWRRLPWPAAVAVMAAYGVSFGFAGLIAFDFHEVAFAVPLLAVVMVALADGRWTAAAAWSLPLLLVKEDLGVTVAAVGVCIAWSGRRMLGLGLVAVGIGGTLLITTVVIPAFNSGHVYLYGQRLAGFPGYLQDSPQRWQILPATCVLTAFVVLRSPLAVVGLPTVAWRVVSNHPDYWRIAALHYNAVLMPVAFVALIDGVGRLRASSHLPMRLWGRLAVPAVAVVAAVSVPQFAFGRVLDGTVWASGPREAAARAVLAQVPDGAFVAVSNVLQPQLVDRARVIRWPNIHPELDPDWVLADTLHPTGIPVPPAQQAVALARLLAPGSGFRRVAERAGYVLLRRERPSAHALLLPDQR